MQRLPMDIGTVIDVDGTRIQITDFLGEGSTSMVYNGKTLAGGTVISGTLVTVKEFYPISDKNLFDIERMDDGQLKFSMLTKECQEFKDRKKQFEAGYQAQKLLANSDVMEITVKPFLLGEYGDSTYLVSDIHMGKSLDKVSFDTLEDKLACVIRVVELFGILHESGYMMLDFKPENILWIDHPKMVKLIDVDSAFSYAKANTGAGDKTAEKETYQNDVLYLNRKYCSPELTLFMEMIQARADYFAEKKGAYLRPKENVYNLGLFMFELIYGRMPSEDDLKFPKNLLEELYHAYESEFGNDSTASELFQVLKRALCESARGRYPHAYAMMAELNTAIEKLMFRKYVPKRTIAKANYTYLSYNILEKYPLYEYSRKVDDNTVLDVALIGSHTIREYLVKTMISCGQMLNSSLNVWLIAEDAETFWKEFKSERRNPELNRTVRWIINGQSYDNSKEIEEGGIVDTPLATVYVYTDDSDDSIRKIVKENKIKYTIFAYEQEEENCAKAAVLVDKLPKQKQFVGYLLGEKKLQVPQKEKIDICPINTDKVSDVYDEKAYKSHIYNMGMSIHEYYYRGNHPRATNKEIREDYAKDIYNIESSERSALHANYKLKSIGINPKSEKAPYEFYEKVLSDKAGKQKEIFDELVALEHRSWTAFMVLSGVRAVDDVKAELVRYAYTGQNDWKEKNDAGQVVRHPCLKASKPGRNLTVKEWENRNNLCKKFKKHENRKNLNEKSKECEKCNNQVENQMENLDMLDRRCLEIYIEIEKIADKRKTDIPSLLEKMKDNFDNYGNEVVNNAYSNLCSATENILSGQGNDSENSWKYVLDELKLICEQEGFVYGDIQQKLKTLEATMKPILWVKKYQDFKDSDEDILWALSKILIQNAKVNNAGENITVIKPLAKDSWQNIFSSIVIHPKTLILVPVKGEDEGVVKQYSQWLKTCHVDTKVEIKNIKQLRKYVGYTFIDETGVAPEHSRAIIKSSHMKDAHTFKVEGRQLKSTDGNMLIHLFNRPVNLTVRETLMLHGATLISEEVSDDIVGLSAVEYKTLWNLYRELKDGRKWKVFINELERLEAAKNKKVNLNHKSQSKVYETDYVEAAVLKQTQLVKVLKELYDHSLLLKYELPSSDKYGKITFTTDYQQLAEVLQEIVENVAAASNRHHYRVEITEAQVILTDDSLYVTGEVPHEPAKEISDMVLYRDEIMQKIHTWLETNNKDKVLQNFRFDSKKSNKLSFRYSSASVREVLRKEGSLLEAVIFMECRRRGIFDDIRCNVEFMWPGNRTKNELDIIGTKNSKTYFISVKMKVPDKMHAYEVQSLCDRFSIEGQAILVSSHFTTGKDEIKGTDYPSRPYALEERIEDMDNVSYIGKDGVDVVNERNERRIVVASSIAEIVAK